MCELLDFEEQTPAIRHSTSPAVNRRKLCRHLQRRRVEIFMLAALQSTNFNGT
jgi:hypothetical protein